MIVLRRDTTGFAVADALGAQVGVVEAPLFGTEPEIPDALAVRSGRFVHRHYIVPAAAIRAIDRDRHAIELCLGRDRLQRFL